MLDTYPLTEQDTLILPSTQELLMGLAENVGLRPEDLGSQALDALTVVEALRRAGHALPGLDAEQAERLLGVMHHCGRLMRDHRPDRFEGDVVLFRATEDSTRVSPSPDTWRPYVSGHLVVHDIACRHGDMTLPVHLDAIGYLLEQHLQSIT